MHRCTFPAMGEYHTLTPSDVEEQARGAGLTIADVCHRAGIAASTFTRWKNGTTKPTLEVYERIRDVVVAAPKSQMTPKSGEEQ